MNGLRKSLQFALLACLFASLSAVAADFSFTDTAGRKHSLAVHRGKWVLVNFWATWCPPCVEEVPDLTALYDARRARDLIVIGVATDDEPAAVKAFAAKHAMHYPVVIGDDVNTRPFGDIAGLPTSYLYDPRGKQVYRKVGGLTRSEIEHFIGK